MDTMTVLQGGDLACPGCGNRLRMIPRPVEPRHFPTAGIIAGLVALVCAAWLIRTFASGRGHRAAERSLSTASPALRTAVGTLSGHSASMESRAEILPRVPTAPPPFACDPRQLVTVRSLGVPVLTEIVPFGKMGPGDRAAKIAARLDDCYVNDFKPPRTVLNMRQGNLIDNPTNAQYVFFGYLHPNGRDTADIIATVDPETAARCGVSPVVLACWWRDILRDWLLIDSGQPPRFTTSYTPLLKDFYARLSSSQGDAPSRFRAASAALIDSTDEYEKLTNLSTEVPSGYKPVPDNYHPILNDDSKPGNSG